MTLRHEGTLEKAQAPAQEPPLSYNGSQSETSDPVPAASSSRHAIDSFDRELASLSPEEYAKVQRSLMWKMDIQVTLLCAVLYTLSFLDRTNIGQAKLLGLTTELGLSGHDYRVALTILYVPYIALELVSNLLLKRLGAARLIPGLVSAWGLVSLCQGLVTTRTGLYINRFFLGCAEAGILPGIVLYLTFFYKPSELQLRQALYFSGASLASAFGALIGAAVSGLDAAGKEPWAWLFIIEGIFTVLVGLLCLFIMPNGPHKLKGLTALEKKMALHRIGRGSGQDYAQGQKHEVLLAEQGAGAYNSGSATASMDKVSPPNTEAAALGTSKPAAQGNDEIEKLIRSFSWSEVLRAWYDPFVIIAACMNFCLATGIYSLAFFAPTIVKSLNISGGNLTLAESLLLVTPPFAAAFVTSIALGVIADRTRWRGGTAIFAFVLAIIGFGMAYGSATPAVRYAAIIVQAMGSYSLPSITLSWISTATWGHYKRATSTATMIVFTNSGGILSTWLFNDDEAPLFRRGFLTNLVLNIVALLLLLMLEAHVWYDRKQKAAGKRDWRVAQTKERFPGATDEQVREYLGDMHPDFMLEY